MIADDIILVRENQEMWIISSMSGDKFLKERY